MGRFKSSREVSQVRVEHGRHGSCLTLTQVRQICRASLLGAQVRMHLVWRCSNRVVESALSDLWIHSSQPKTENTATNIYRLI
jgi:hypothetical protein